MVGIICAVATIISNVGISTMIASATPLLNTIYPIMLTQIVLSFFNEKIHNDYVFRGAALGALITCVLGVACDFGANIPIIEKLPLASLDLEWILPAAICGLMGAVIPAKRRQRAATAAGR